MKLWTTAVLVGLVANMAPSRAGNSIRDLADQGKEFKGIVSCYHALAAYSLAWSSNEKDNPGLILPQSEFYDQNGVRGILRTGTRVARGNPQQRGFYLFSAKQTVFFPMPSDLKSKSGKKTVLLNLKMPPPHKNKFIKVRCTKSQQCSKGWPENALNGRKANLPAIEGEGYIPNESAKAQIIDRYLKPDLLLVIDGVAKKYALWGEHRKFKDFPQKYALKKSVVVNALLGCRDSVSDVALTTAVDNELAKIDAQAGYSAGVTNGDAQSVK